MEFIISCILSMLLVFIVLQDFSYRAVHLALLGAIFLVSSVLLYFKTSTLFNTQTFVYIVLIFAVLWMYLSIKNKKITNPLKRHIGLGDILFLIAVTPLFYVYNYILFFVTGMLLTLVVTLVLKKYINKQTVPLAGILSAYLLILLVSSFFVDHDIFYSQFFTLRSI